CDAKYYDYDLATFTAGADMILYVAFDVRVATLPSWMSGWTDTGLQFASSNEVTFAVYSKEFSSGEVVTLGTNGQSASCINYVAFAQPQSQEIVDDIIWGDANADGIVNSIDATMVTRSALNAITLSAEAQACCDVNRDGIINSIDATIITRYALKVIEQLPVA
ncbi:MAG: dockerin type I repeat-containing protein, partial [Oscillospiraceae bacterium]|nr:dockerin type I repeat-containing protein [Oscillospiraceae bacterium]